MQAFLFYWVSNAKVLFIIKVILPVYSIAVPMPSRPPQTQLPLLARELQGLMDSDDAPVGNDSPQAGVGLAKAEPKRTSAVAQTGQFSFWRELSVCHIE